MQFSRLVSPPRPLCRRWWTSHAAAGWWQPPAHWRNLSRSLTALRIAAGASSLYPTSRGRARAGQAGAELLAAQEAGQPAWARDQGDGLADDGAFESLAAEPGRGGQQDLEDLGDGRVRDGRSDRVGGGRGGVTGVAGCGVVKGGA